MCQEEQQSGLSKSPETSSSCDTSSVENRPATDARMVPTGSASSGSEHTSACPATSAKLHPGIIPPREGCLMGLRQWRTVRQMTLADLAAIVGVNPAFLSQVERGLKCVSVPVLQRLAAALECSVRDLLEERDLFGGRRE